MSGNSRVIFSVYNEVNDNSVTDYKKEQLSKYKNSLMQRQNEYANFCKADYFVYESEEQIDNEYNSIQFFKIKQLEKLAEEYDEILYLDLDVVPFVFKNFFKEHDMSKICCLQEDGFEKGLKRNFEKWKEFKNLQNLDSMNCWVKSCSKNAMLLLDTLKSSDNMIINTGVIAGNKDVIKQLKFTENLDYMINLMKEAQYDNVYPKEMHKFMLPNNEVFFSYLIEKNKIPVNYIDDSWNYILDKTNKKIRNWHIRDKNFLHVIHKNFYPLTYYNILSSGNF